MPPTTALKTTSLPIRQTTQRPERDATRVLKVLIIDDSAFDRKRVERQLRETGLQFEVSGLAGTNGLRQALDRQSFDLALVDFRLQEEDGLEAVRRIRSHPGHVNAAIIMLSGNCEVEVAVEALKSGCADYIDKANLSPNALRRAIMNAVEKSSLQNDLMRARGLNEKLTCMVRDFARDSVLEMKPIVLRIMRNARTKLASPAARRDPEAEELDTSCRQLWALMEAMEQTTPVRAPLRPRTHRQHEIE